MHSSLGVATKVHHPGQLLRSVPPGLRTWSTRDATDAHNPQGRHPLEPGRVLIPGLQDQLDRAPHGQPGHPELAGQAWTEAFSRRILATAHRPARAVSWARGGHSGVCSVNVRAWHPSPGHRQRDVHHRMRTGALPMAASTSSRILRPPGHGDLPAPLAPDQERCRPDSDDEHVVVAAAGANDPQADRVHEHVATITGGNSQWARPGAPRKVRHRSRSS